MDRPVLGIDTASRRGSLAIAGVDGPVPFEELMSGGRHSVGLVPAIEALLTRGGLAARHLVGIGVVSGPGSFTGLRVGLATAKGLGYSLDVPVEGLSTLEAIARAAAAGQPAEAGPFCALVEAGRGEIYAARFRLERGAALRLEPDAAWKPDDLAAALAPGSLLAGDAAPRLLAAGPARFRVLEVPPLAPVVAAWARDAIPPGTRYRPGGPTPNYVRSSDGEPARRPA